MWQADPARLAGEISNHFGLHFIGESGNSPSGETSVLLSPAGVHPSDAFRIRVELGWRSLKAEFIPGAFAGSLITQMGLTDARGRAVFERMAAKCAIENARVEMSVNGRQVDAQDSKSWPDSWQNLQISLLKSPLAINTEDHAESDRLLSLWTKRFAGLTLALTPLEEESELTELNPEGLPEGGGVRVLVNRYERSYTNRMTCIAIHGCRCMACGFDFDRIYGDIGDGFIHVHHVTPVSELAAGYIVDPARDLVPLCPNCHAMAHTSSPPLTVEELKRILAQNVRSGQN